MQLNPQISAATGSRAVGLTRALKSGDDASNWTYMCFPSMLSNPS